MVDLKDEVRWTKICKWLTIRSEGEAEIKDVLEFLAWVRVGEGSIHWDREYRDVERQRGEFLFFLSVRFDYLYDDIYGKMSSVGQ